MVTMYTAVGRFEKRSDKEGHSYPAVIAGGDEHILDISEMVVWTILNWRICELPKISELYSCKLKGAQFSESRHCDEIVARLLQRGLIASGTGDCGGEALYDMLTDLYILPLASIFPAKVLAFLRLTFVKRMPWRFTRRIFQKVIYTPDEKQVMSLVKQQSLSTAEVIRCVDHGVTDIAGDKIMDTVYGDDVTTSENLSAYARLYEKQQAVLSTIANLYLRQLILFEVRHK